MRQQGRGRFALSVRVRVLAAAGVVAVLAVGSSAALFSDSGAVTTTIAAGTLDLRFDADQQGSPTPYVVTFTDAQALAPGVSASQDLVVYNSGSVPATLSLTAPTVTNAATGTQLQDELTLTVAAGTTTLYTGPLDGATFTGLSIGADGTQATGTVLTLTVTMDGDAPIAVAGQQVQLDLPFLAEQVAS